MIRLAKIIVAGTIPLCSLGVAPAQGEPLHVRVATFTPAPYVAPTTSPLIIETIEYVPYPTPPTNSPQITSQAVTSISGLSGDLMGSIGYARAGGNCVNEPGVNNPRNGNPINWPVTSQTPHIGSTALWNYNHVGVVVGIWSNGDLEIRHQNFSGGQHRFSRSQFRGFR